MKAAITNFSPEVAARFSAESNPINDTELEKYVALMLTDSHGGITKSEALAYIHQYGIQIEQKAEAAMAKTLKKAEEVHQAEFKQRENLAREKGRLESWTMTYDFLHSADRSLCDDWEQEYKAWEEDN